MEFPFRQCPLYAHTQTDRSYWSAFQLIGSCLISLSRGFYLYSEIPSQDNGEDEDKQKAENFYEGSGGVGEVKTIHPKQSHRILCGSTKPVRSTFIGF